MSTSRGSCPVWTIRGRWRASSPLRGCPGQGDHETGVGFVAHGSAVRPGQLVDDPQPETDRVAVGTGVALEQRGDLGLRYTRPVVADPDGDRPVGRFGLHQYRWL